MPRRAKHHLLIRVLFRSLLSGARGGPVQRVLFALGVGLTLSPVAMAVKHYFDPGKPAYLTAMATRGDVESNVMATGTLQAHRQGDGGGQGSGPLRGLQGRVGRHR